MFFLCFASSSTKTPRLSCLLGSLVALGYFVGCRPIAKEKLSEDSRQVGRETPERLLAVEGREEVRAGVGAEGPAGTWTGCSLRGRRPLGKGVTRPRFCSAAGGLLRSGQMSCQGGASKFAEGLAVGS